MAKDKKQTITIDNKEYNTDDLKPEQVIYLNHITDLDRKMSQLNFNLEQLKAGRESFARLLNDSLNIK